MLAAESPCSEVKDDSQRGGEAGTRQGQAVNSLCVLTRYRAPAGNGRQRRSPRSQKGQQLSGVGRTSGSKDSRGWFGSLAGDHVIHTGFF